MVTDRECGGCELFPGILTSGVELFACEKLLGKLLKAQSSLIRILKAILMQSNQPSTSY